jgi:hypothetical protein
MRIDSRYQYVADRSDHKVVLVNPLVPYKHQRDGINLLDSRFNTMPGE